MAEQTDGSEVRPWGGAGWVVVLAGLGVNLVLGVLYAWTMMGRALLTLYPNVDAKHIDPRNWTQTEATAPFAVGTAAFAITMIFAGRVQDKIGPKWVAVLGGVMLGLGMLASGWVRTPLLMMVTFGVLGGMGIGLGYAATTPSAIKWFPPVKKGLVTGIVVAGVGLAAVYMAPLTDYMLRALAGKDPWLGISRTFMILGAGTIVVVCGLALLLRNPPAGYVAGGGGGSRKAGAAVRADRNWPEMLRSGSFYLLWLMYVLAAAPGLMLIANARDIAAAQAPGWRAGFVLVMTLAVFNTLGRVGGGYVSDQIGRTYTMVLFFALQAVNMFCFAQYQGSNWLIFGAAATGLCYGTIFTLMPAATADFYGVKNLGVNYGILFTAFGVAGVLGSMLGGRVRDLTQTYGVAYLTVAGALVLAALLALATRAPQGKMVGAISSEAEGLGRERGVDGGAAWARMRSCLIGRMPIPRREVDGSAAGGARMLSRLIGWKADPTAWESSYWPGNRRKEWNMAGRWNAAAVLGAAAALALGAGVRARRMRRRGGRRRRS